MWNTTQRILLMISRMLGGISGTVVVVVARVVVVDGRVVVVVAGVVVVVAAAATGVTATGGLPAFAEHGTANAEPMLATMSRFDGPCQLIVWPSTPVLSRLVIAMSGIWIWKAVTLPMGVRSTTM